MNLRKIMRPKYYCQIQFFMAIFILCLYQNTAAQDSDAAHFIRHNLIGYLVQDKKVAIIGSGNGLEGQSFFLVWAAAPESIA